jgi:hypothetical protein
MAKSYKLLKINKSIPYEEISKKYEGYWVYLVNVKYSKEGRLLSGVPVIIGSIPYDGAEDGIYEQFKTKQYERRIGASLLTNDDFISCFNILGFDNG